MHMHINDALVVQSVVLSVVRLAVNLVDELVEMWAETMDDKSMQMVH